MEDVTRLPERAASVATTPASDWGRPGQFSPGTLLAGRFRIVAPLGRGGMGEVYRAEDLKLDQTVALKFLPDALAHDPARLAQFHNEVRVARTVSHRNVCRMYDIGDANGRPFLTMEYVDGEDLASLLRRIGRFPQDKAIEVARQLCGGLAAAHERGVLHRDLKPANVMIDGEGHVRITDFGLAALAGSVDNVRAGTPAYMAPEQLAGREVTQRSDIYALGLVLFELFTGKRVFEAGTLNELIALHESDSVATPSSVVRDLELTIERAILRCLERDPARRPPSALAVSAALPGGDQLAAALAAGETPSPEMVAAAGEQSALQPAVGLSLVGFTLAMLVVLAALSQQFSLIHQIPIGTRYAVVGALLTMLRALVNALQVVAIVVFLKILVKRTWLVLVLGTLFVLPVAMTGLVQGQAPAVEGAIFVAGVLLVIGVLLRFGLLAVIVTFYTFIAMEIFPLTTDLSRPYAGTSAVVVIAIAGYGFYASRGGEPLFGRTLLD